MNQVITKSTTSLDQYMTNYTSNLPTRVTTATAITDSALAAKEDSKTSCRNREKPQEAAQQQQQQTRTPKSTTTTITITTD